MQKDRVALIGSAHAAVLIVLAALVLALASRPAERVVPIAGLQSGVDFELASVRFQQLAFEDLSMVDIGYIVTFRLRFSDGGTEDLQFTFDGYCAVGTVSEASSAHRSPTAVLRHTCGDDFIRALVA